MRPVVNSSSPRAALEIALWRHGCLWVLGTILAAAAISAYVAALRPSQRTLASLDIELRNAQQGRAADPISPQLPAPQSEQQRLQTLQAMLRQSPDAAELVRKMVELAQVEQIQLVQSDYQRQFHKPIQVSQVQITQPVRATYPQLRRYIESVLRAVPNASLDQIAARRDHVGQVQVEARLRWSLWIQSAPPRATATHQEPKP